MTDSTYNGWRNYETWCVNLWLTNDEGGDAMLREQAEQCLRDAIDNDESDPRAEAATALAQWLEEFHDEMAPEVTGVFADLQRAALGAVDWREIAENLLQDIDVYSAGWNMPGYMPDNPPALFLDDSDARDFIADEIERAIEEDENDIKGDAEWVESIRKGSGDFGQTFGKYHYFVSKV